MTAALVVAGIVLAAVSGVPGLFLGRASAAGERIAALLMALAAAAGAAGAIGVLARGPASLVLPWSVPGGAFALRLDAIAAMFLLQIFALALAGALYGLGYWPQREHARDGRRLRLFYGATTGGMALLVAADNTMLFLVGWEVMALAAFLALTSQDDRAEVRQAGFVYLVATRLATACLFAMFALLFAATGTFAFTTPPANTAPGLAAAIFVLALVGFGLKAGLVPLHVWLPGAHASAPSHVSALLSGVLVKMGIYGIVRVTSLFAAPPAWWGTTVLALGVISGVLGVLFAIGQHDLKRLLAYHSIENVGIIAIGLGVALLGRSLGSDALLALGLAGALLHVWNHGLFKALLFLAAGSVLHATGTRELDALGGLAKRMPFTALAFVTGAVAIAGLPPLNGFVSELLIYLGLFRAAALPGSVAWLAGAFAAPALALVGALALACFVKAFGAVFLGEGRSSSTATAHEAGAWMLGPMLALGFACALVGLAPPLVAPVLHEAVGAWAPERASTLAPLSSLAPLGWVSLAGIVLVLSLGLAWLYLRARTRAAPCGVGTWDCGYAAPSARMQYTSSSFAQGIVGLFGWALRPRVRAPAVLAVFPAPTRFHSEVPDLLLDRLLLPAASLGGRVARWVGARVQHGSGASYLAYILLVVLVLFLWL